MRKSLLALPLLAVGAFFACAPTRPLATVPSVDLERFMGDWYVVGNIPTFLEKGAHNAVETYELKDPRTVATTFRFRKDGFDGPEKVYHPTGFVSADYALWVPGAQMVLFALFFVGGMVGSTGGGSKWRRSGGRRTVMSISSSASSGR